MMYSNLLQENKKKDDIYPILDEIKYIENEIGKIAFNKTIKNYGLGFVEKKLGLKWKKIKNHLNKC